MNEMLILRTKYVYFTFKGKTCVQNDGIVVGSPLGLFPAYIFMRKLEKSLLQSILDTGRDMAMAQFVS